jgi:hypothetical protein
MSGCAFHLTGPRIALPFFSCLWKSLGFPVILQLLPGCARDRFPSNWPRSSLRGLLAAAVAVFNVGGTWW